MNLVLVSQSSLAKTRSCLTIKYNGRLIKPQLYSLPTVSAEYRMIIGLKNLG